MASGPHRKALGSLALLVTWEIWNERNARVFQNKFSPPFIILDKIKKEIRLQITAGAKGLSEIMPGEQACGVWCGVLFVFHTLYLTSS